MEIPFIGGSYEQRYPGINAQRSINCFPVVDQNDAKTIIALRGTPGLKFFSRPVVYGSGDDGEVTISVDTVLTRDMQYTTLTVNEGVTLDTKGFIVSCSVALINNGTITDNYSGGNGGRGGVGSNPGYYGTNPIRPLAGQGGKGGWGYNTGVGGTGGKGGGQVILYARTLTNNGVIHADGFDAPIDAVSPGFYGNGGNAGVVLLFYENRTVGTVSAVGGLKGSSGA